MDYVHMDKIKITKHVSCFTGNVTWNRGCLLLWSFLLLPLVMWVGLAHKSGSKLQRCTGIFARRGDRLSLGRSELCAGLLCNYAVAA